LKFGKGISFLKAQKLSFKIIIVNYSLPVQRKQSATDRSLARSAGKDYLWCSFV